MLNKIDWQSQIGRRLRLRDLHVFMTVVQCGSMAKAAQLLGVSHPSVSEVISDLERALGVRLLDRTSRGIAPTIYGSALLKRSISAFDELKLGVRDIEFLSNPQKGELRIGCSESLATSVLPSIISAFSRQYPDVTISFDDIGTRATEELGPSLRDRKLDCVLQRFIPSLPRDERNRDLQVDVLFDDDFVIAAGSHSPWVRRRKIALTELTCEPWILPPPGTWYHAFVCGLFRSRGLDAPQARLATNSVALRMRLLKEGPYLATFAKSIVQLNADRYGLKVLRVDAPRQSLPAGVVTLKDRTSSPIVGRFVAVARQVSAAVVRSVNARQRNGRSPHQSSPSC